MKKIHFFLLNLLAALLLIGMLCLSVLHWLEKYTRHGEYVSVPSLHGMSLEEADSLVTSAHLHVQVIDSLYDKDAEPGSVLEQYPAAGSSVKGNRLLYLTVNARNPEKAVLPDLRNTAYRQTIQTLEGKGFRIGHIEYAESEFKNLVLQLKQKGEEILPGTLLNKGSEIDIVLGSGNGGNTVSLPSLLGKRLTEAVDLLRKSYLNIGEIIPDGSINPTDKASAFIYQQSPEANETVEAGTPVNLFITVKKEKSAVTDSARKEETVLKDSNRRHG